MFEAGQISPDRAARWTMEIASALAFAHSKGILHRDITPRNIMIDDRDRAVILDFGLARFCQEEGNRSHTRTETGMVMGSPGYLSPEMALGDPRNVDERSDVFSLGLCLFHMLAGRPGLSFRNVYEYMYEVSTNECPRLVDLVPEIDPTLDEICYRATRRIPENRYQSAAEMAEALVSYLDDSAPRPAKRIRTSGSGIGTHWPTILGFVVSLVMLVLWLTCPPGPIPEIEVDIILQQKEEDSGNSSLNTSHLPLIDGDKLQFRVTVGEGRKGYLYLFWIDGNGNIEPLRPRSAGKLRKVTTGVHWEYPLAAEGKLQDWYPVTPDGGRRREMVVAGFTTDPLPVSEWNRFLENRVLLCEWGEAPRVPPTLEVKIEDRTRSLGTDLVVSTLRDFYPPDQLPPSVAVLVLPDNSYLDVLHVGPTSQTLAVPLNSRILPAMRSLGMDPVQTERAVQSITHRDDIRRFEHVLKQTFDNYHGVVVSHAQGTRI